MNGIEYPVTLKAIDRFERQNATISVNVYGYENGDIYPLRVSKHEHNTCVNLLLIDDGEKNTSMNRLLSAQSSKNEHTRHDCLRCLNSFISEDFLSKHKEYCDSNDAVKIEMPKKGSTLNFKHFFKSMRVPFIVYADFESFAQKLDTAQPYPYDSYTKQYQKHTPSGFCYYKQNPVIYTKQIEDEDHKLRFIDSFKFMASSLDKLVGNLQKDQFVNLECGASGINGKYKGKQLSLTHKALLKRKSVYPYDYVDGLEKLAETQLPPKNEFYSKLSGDDISDEDYVHAQQVWKEFECKTMGDYHNMYITSDVLLLADVFETFRDDAALKLTEVELELISDPDMLLMIGKGITGGVSTIMTGYGNDNNKCMGDEFDPKKDSTYLHYLDANNLYGWAMSKPLPTTVHMKKTKIRFDKPVYLGMCILDLSKTLMYEFHYYYIKPNYILDAYGTSGAKGSSLFTDTDSLAYEIKTEDFYADINENVEQMFDTSNFPADHPSGIKSGVNKMFVGMFKDECGGKIMHESVGLRAKLYSYRMYEGSEPLAGPNE
ncbi:hypothetical protein MAR_034091 [Mya arenaria]|uniref:DNA-directed DNA polymerase n=1 Tax=Mya arenaria TaxID=6604 RepID=A0ABY7GDF9_MYAAR|nr:hypothetical protein MAR_034091 [Mya arenaria]